MNTYKFKKEIFCGVATAIVTPFCKGEVDYALFKRLCRFQCDGGVNALCVCGTTGEAATLALSERHRLLTACREEVGEKLPLIAGCGSSDTATAVKYAKDAKEAGADALLVITPYCNKGTAKGLSEHYKRVADAVDDLPVIVYNVPSRTGVDISFSQYNEFSKIENIVAVKEATNNMTKITRLCGETPLTVYSGNDDMILPVISVGGRGVISVLSNLFPKETARYCAAALSGDYVSASKAAQKYAHLVELLFTETNPAPLKFAMSVLGLCSAEMRLPMGDISDGLKEKIKEEIGNL